jgi:hypothetical protein
MPAVQQPLRLRALKLPAKKRISLAVLLLESIDDPPGPDSSLLTELKKRADDLRTGRVKSLTTEEAYGFSL